MAYGHDDCKKPHEQTLYMPFQPVTRTPLYRQVAEQLAGLIRKGEYKPGQRLPSDRELARLLQVSRPTIREAVIALDVAGLVHVRPGAGIFVREPASNGYNGPGLENIHDPGPFEVIEARRHLEGEAAYLAASRADPEDLVLLGNHLDAMRRAAADGRGDLAADIAFHRIIARACANSFITAAIEATWPLREGNALWQRLERDLPLAKLQLLVVDDHAAILQALKEQNPQAARTAMHYHLDRVGEAIGQFFSNND